MSLVLDALHKADRERRDEQSVPTWQAIHGDSAGPDNSARRWRFIAIALAGLIVVVVVISPVFLTPQPIVPVRRQTSAAAVDSAQAPTVDRAPVEISKIPEPSPPVPAVAQAAVPSRKIQSLYTRTPDAPSGKAEKPIPVSTETEADFLAPSESNQTTQTTEPFWPDEYASLPYLTDLPEQFRDKIPSLRYTEHRMQSDPRLSEVVLNNVSYRIGDRIANKLTLVDILSDSIVLELGNKKFRLRKFNNWINM